MLKFMHLSLRNGDWIDLDIKDKKVFDLINKKTDNARFMFLDMVSNVLFHD